jgi:hypothetical protein
MPAPGAWLPAKCRKMIRTGYFPEPFVRFMDHGYDGTELNPKTEVGWGIVWLQVMW